MNILVADDAKESVELLKDWLSMRGYNADVAFNGKQVLDLIKLNKYNLRALQKSQKAVILRPQAEESR